MLFMNESVIMYITLFELHAKYGEREKKSLACLPWLHGDMTKPIIQCCLPCIYESGAGVAMGTSMNPKE